MKIIRSPTYVPFLWVHYSIWTVCPIALEISGNGSKTQPLCLQKGKWLSFAATKLETDKDRCSTLKYQKKTSCHMLIKMLEILTIIAAWVKLPTKFHLWLVGPGHCTLHKIKTQSCHNANRSKQLFSMAIIYLASPSFFPFTSASNPG